MIPTATEALRLLRSRELSATELLETIFGRIERLDPTLHAYVALDREGARAAAEAADRAYARGVAPALAGLPISLKDLFALRGEVAGCGVPTPPRPEPAVADAPVVQTLREAGAVLLGRTHLHALAFGLDGENPALGTPVNPRAPGHLPGGSSSGSAVSVAAGLALASLGTDTGGSVRLPAAFCGIVGFKPTHGAVDATGVFPVAPSIDHVGFFARSVADCRLLFDVLQRQERELDAELRHEPRVGLLADLHDRAQADVRAAIEACLGASSLSVARVELPTLRSAKRAYGPLVLAEIAWGHEALLAAQPDNYDAAARAMVERGAAVRAVDYLRADAERRDFAAAVEALLDDQELDVLALPTVGIPAPRLGQTEVDIDGRSRAVAGVLVAGTSLFSMAGLPAISLPAGEVDGRPVGLQLVAARGDEGRLLAVAETIERVRGSSEVADASS